MSDLDPQLTFDSFVVGPANRLASAAARRAADSPGTSYNPLFVYSASGLGKTHILISIANQAQKTDANRRVEYMALEKYLARLETALGAGESDGEALFGDVEILLLDDVQFLTGQPEAQEMLLRTLDELSTAGSQIVLASDRPPADINGLDARLLSRFSGGLLVDIGAPEYETRVAIIRKKAEERGQTLEPGVAEALGRHPFKNVRELGGGLNKILAIQELEERQVVPEEVPSLLAQSGASSIERLGGEFDSFLDDLVSTVADAVEEKEEPWRKAVRESVDAAEREGFSTLRLEPYQSGSEPDGWEAIIDKFRSDVDRLRDIDNELDRLGNPWPEAAAGVLKDPDRLEEAEALLTSVRERQRPFPKLGSGPKVGDLKDFQPIAIKAATQLIGEEKPEYNPLYVWSEDQEVGKTLLGAVGRTHQAAHPDRRMAVTSVEDFAEDFIRALGEGVAGAWRERWWTVDLLLVYGVEALAETERAQDEFFHLFEALKRRGARVMLVSDRTPASIDSIDDRLRSRFEGGLALQLEAGSRDGELVLVEQEFKPLDDSVFLAGLSDTSARASEGAAREPAEPAPAPVLAEAPKKGGVWFPGPENVVILWPNIEELLMEELD